jgi:chromosome segregation ATPase
MSDNKKIDYIQEKIDSVASTVASIDKEVALQKAALENHTQQDAQMYEEFKRMNDLLQDNVNSLKEHMENNVLLKDMIIRMDNRLNPIEMEFIQKTAVRNWVLIKAKFIGKVGGAIVAVAGVWVYVKPLLEHLFK